MSKLSMTILFCSIGRRMCPCTYKHSYVSKKYDIAIPFLYDFFFLPFFAVKALFSETSIYRYYPNLYHEMATAKEVL